MSPYVDYNDSSSEIHIPGRDVGYDEESKGAGLFNPRAWSYSPCRHTVRWTLLAIFLSWVIGLHIAYPFPTTIPVFIGGAFTLLAWTALEWYRVVEAVREKSNGEYEIPLLSPEEGQGRSTLYQSAFTTGRKVRLGLSTCAILYLCFLGFIPPREHVPELIRTDPSRQDKYFIAALLYNNEAVFGGWSTELLKLCDYLGHDSTYISIYESNSDDSIPALLKDFGDKLAHANISHRIISTRDNDRHWPYSISQERIDYLAKARNRAMEPLQSEDEAVRLPDYHEYSRIVFINDVIYKWEAVARLIATRMDQDETKPGEYDLACGLDYSLPGVYDTWVARDVCGTPFRFFWPYVKDPVSIELIKEEKPFEAAACWNGVVVYPAQRYLYQPPTLEKRRWQMIDNSSYYGSVSSPPLTTPIKFRSTGVEACDHSECFLFSYDLHRVYNKPERRPRILINPTVKVAYLPHWFRWHNTVLRIPAVKWWNEVWSRGLPLRLVDWMWEYGGRRRDYCTWAGFNIPERCPTLPGARRLSWEEG